MSRSTLETGCFCFIFQEGDEDVASINSQLQALNDANPALKQTNAKLSAIIGSFERLRQVSSTAIDPTGFVSSNTALERVRSTIVLINKGMEETEKKEKKALSLLEAGAAAADKLFPKIGKVVKQYATLGNLLKVVNLSDSLANSANRLSLIVDDGGSVDALQNKILGSAEASRSSYTDLMETVSTLGLTAENAFSGNDEIIRFAELINKGMALSGTPAAEQSGISSQVTQAMSGSGLDSGGARALIENAPVLAASIESYMQSAGVEGTMQEWATSGLITADVIKNALFSASDSINTRFSQLPMTWSQIGTSIQNQAISAFAPVLQKINELANSESIQGLIGILVDSFSILALAASGALDLVAGIASVIQQGWPFIQPIIMGVVAALALYTTYLGVAKAAQIAETVVKTASIFASYAYALLKKQEVASTIAATAAQNGYNTALLSCPLVWILLIIIAVIAAFYAVIAVINQVTGASISATGIIFGAITTAVAAIWNIFLGLAELVLGIISYLINPFIEFGNFLANVFTNPVSSIIYLFQGLANNVLGFIESIASALDFVFGSNMADTVASWRRELKAYADDAVKKYAPNENYERKFDSLDLSIDGISEALGIDLNRWDYSDAWNTGYNAGEGLESSIGDMFGGFSGGDLFDSSLLDPSAYTASSASGLSGGGAGPGAYDTGSLGAISGDTAAIRENTARSEEDLSLLREIAEREAINRFTTAEVKVDMTGMNNTIHSDMDIDGFITVFTDRFAEALTATAEGVHV